MARIESLGWLWVTLLAVAVVVLAAAEWPRLSARYGPDARRTRSRSRRKSQLTLLQAPDDESDEFAASVERDLARLPTTRDRDG